MRWIFNIDSHQSTSASRKKKEKIGMIMDQRKRPLRDLRISVLDRCNFRCQYCMPAEIFGQDYPFLAKKQLLTYEEIARLAKIFVSLGVEKIRLTGGEPLMRKELEVLVAKLVRIKGLKDIALTTNGVYLPKYAKALKTAGLQRVNISLDSLDDAVFAKINGRGVAVKPVLKGIEHAQAAGLDVKINMVVKKGVNDGEILPMAHFCKNVGIQLRFIEYMDVGNTNGWKMDEVMTKKEIFQLLQEDFMMEAVDPLYFGEVAKRYRYQGTNGEVGFVTSVSEAFCSSCTRGRLSCDGKFFTCLFNGTGHDLREDLRRGKPDEDIRRKIAAIWNRRFDRYSEERLSETIEKTQKAEMSYIGG
ncbi:GTP 3',8-cyclase MoaA [Bacillaceae bacterium Marseille-Q3522]|nr:GTP 3',8-cyclase MoaA [Bacillaceae bacterium Marseille-Q3522]